MDKFKYHLHFNIKILLSAIAIMMIWRAVWGVLDNYFFPGSKAIGYSLAFLIGIGVLLVDDWLLKELDEKS